MLESHDQRRIEYRPQPFGLFVEQYRPARIIIDDLDLIHILGSVTQAASQAVLMAGKCARNVERNPAAKSTDIQARHAFPATGLSRGPAGPVTRNGELFVLPHARPLIQQAIPYQPRSPLASKLHSPCCSSRLRYVA